MNSEDYSRSVERLRKRCVAFFGSDQVWDEIESAYTEPHRAYHNLQHLRELFESLDPHLAGIEHRQAVEIAVWFHDFVYVVEPVRYAANELESALAMPRVLALCAPKWLDEPLAREVALASEFILSTKKHRIDSQELQGSPSAEEAGRLFLDADLAILAAPPSRFEDYDQSIGREWGQDPSHPSVAFCEGRTRAMESFSQRETLFYSSQLKHLEPLARQNLAALVGKWKALASR